MAPAGSADNGEDKGGRQQGEEHDADAEHERRGPHHYAERRPVVGVALSAIILALRSTRRPWTPESTVMSFTHSSRSTSTALMRSVCASNTPLAMAAPPLFGNYRIHLVPLGRNGRLLRRLSNRKQFARSGGTP